MPHEKEHIQKLLEDRYYLRDEEGNLLEHSPEEMFARVAMEIADAEKSSEDMELWQTEFYYLMKDNKFLPNTPTLINAGKSSPGSFSACFVLPVEDSMEGIFDAVKKAALISKAGGGVGFNFGNLREKGSLVKSTGHRSSGPISFMRVFDTMCDTISQGGVRRGAMIAVLPVWHPDIEEFISCKDDGVTFSNFNISVGITDEFMEAVKEGKSWKLVSPSDGLTKNWLPARELFQKIVEHAWKTGDPGLYFLDTVNKNNPLYGEENRIECCNPCGEIGLRNYESCNLGSINLMAYLKQKFAPNNDGLTDSWYEFDLDALKEDIPTMVRFLDNVIEVNPYPLPEIEKATKESRKIGLGIMGWADCLIKMKIPYDSQEALDLAEELMRFIKDIADSASYNLGDEKGVYPLFDDKTNMPERRNATLLCVAPTGTISRIAGVSSGIEPIFAWETHHKLVDLEYDEIHWSWKEFDNSRLHTGVALPTYMKTANEIHFNWHLAMQAAFQKHIDNSVSKTINLSADATVDDVYDIYLEAWKLGLKGITIYRDGSKDNQPLNKIEEKSLEKVAASLDLNEVFYSALKDKQSSLKRRGPVAVGVTHKVDTGKGKIYVTVNYSEYHAEPVEVFIRLGHLATPSESALAEWSGRLLSLMLKYNLPINDIVKQGNKVYSDMVFWYNKKSFCSFPKLISHLLSYTFEEAMEMAEMDLDSMKEFPAIDSTEESRYDIIISGDSVTREYCYNCGTYGMIKEGGCSVCENCGFENCG